MPQNLLREMTGRCVLKLGASISFKKIKASVNSSLHLMSFCVDPKRDCPHVLRPSPAIIAHGAHCIASSACSACGDTSENWLDVVDGSVNCSRHVSGHAALHAQATSHALSVSFSDLSVWCYACDSYIASPLLDGLLNALQAAKHSPSATAPASACSADAISAAPDVRLLFHVPNRIANPLPQFRCKALTRLPSQNLAAVFRAMSVADLKRLAASQ